jgi:hypothetical protein
MAKINLTASAYRVARGKAEIVREGKWLKTAKLTTKKSLELKKRKPAEKGIDGSGGPREFRTGQSHRAYGARGSG